VRFELGYYALEPDIRVIAPWREWVAASRDKLLKYAEKHTASRWKAKERRFALQHGRESAAHFLRGPHPGGPGQGAGREHVALDRSAGTRRIAPEYVELNYRQGDIVAINGKKLSPATVLQTLNKLGGKHGIGRLDLVENRYVGMKSRGCYETPGGTIMLRAHRAIESVCLDREVAHLKDDLMPRYAALIYNGYWWSPERRMLQGMIDASQANVNGWVRVKLYKGNVIVVGRDSNTDSLFDTAIATFEDDRGAYDQMDAAGFIRLNALRMRIAANLRKRQKKS
jgi:argininosuccinate synthase